MSEILPLLYVARHGETAWTLSGQYTGSTDLPLTQRGEQTALRLGERLRKLSFVKVLSSPLQRARRTCELAGFGAMMEIDPDLREWDYGEYEGRYSREVHAEHPDWNMFHDGCPGGESPKQISARADRVIKRVRDADDNVLVFSSGHFIRVLAARWLGLKVSVNSRHFALFTGSLSVLGYDHDRSHPVIRLWNDDSHVAE